MPSQRVVIAIPEQHPTSFLVLAMQLRDFMVARGYVVSTRIGDGGFDDDVTPVDGAELPAVLLDLREYFGVVH